MLKITIAETSTEQTLILEGRLTGPYVAELERAWQNARRANGHRCIVDLRNTTFIDEAAETLLARMKRDGAHFVACGVCTTYRLKRLGIRCTH